MSIKVVKMRDNSPFAHCPNCGEQVGNLMVLSKFICKCGEVVTEDNADYFTLVYYNENE